MRAAVFTGFSGPTDIKVRTVDEPLPQDDDALIRVDAASVNRHDLWYLSGDGRISQSDLPFISGVDVAGVVEDAPENQDRITEGDRVVLCPMQTCGSCVYCRDGPENLCTSYGLFHGGFAEKVVAPVDRLIPLPNSVNTIQASALPVSYMTAMRMLKCADIEPGQRVLIPGATGGVGVAAVQLAGLYGAETVATSSSKSKLDQVSELGADRTVHSADPAEISEAVVKMGRADIVIDHMGDDFTTAGLEALARGGTVVTCGATVSGSTTVDLWDLFLRHKRMVGSTMGTQRDLKQLVSLVSRDELVPTVSATYDLSDTARAFQDMENREMVGKLLITP